MTAHPRALNGCRHEVTPTPPNHYGHPPDALAEDHHALLAAGETAERRFGTRALAAALILAAIVAAVVFGG